MVGTVLFLGAGATKSCGGPLTNEILPKFLAASDPLSPPTLLTDFFGDSSTSVQRRRQSNSLAFR